MSLLLAAAAAAAQAPVAEPRGLSLHEAQTLPAPAVRERVLGAVGVLYPEIARPSAAITRGSGFQIAFASTPRSAGFPGLCQADTITVDFGPSADGPTTAIVHVQAIWRGNVHRIIGDTAPLAGGWHDSDERGLATRCAAAGPVLYRPGMPGRGFFTGSYNLSGAFWASHAYFGARALAKAREGALAPAGCRDYMPGPGDNLCDDPSALLRNLSMDRFLGFQIDRCARDDPDLCVTASFSRGPIPDRRFIAIQIRTSLSEMPDPPADFALREIRIRGSAIVD